MAPPKLSPKQHNLDGSHILIAYLWLSSVQARCVPTLSDLRLVPSHQMVTHRRESSGSRTNFWTYEFLSDFADEDLPRLSCRRGFEVSAQASSDRSDFADEDLTPLSYRRGFEVSAQASSDKSDFAPTAPLCRVRQFLLNSCNS